MAKEVMCVGCFKNMVEIHPEPGGIASCNGCGAQLKTVNADNNTVRLV